MSVRFSAQAMFRRSTESEKPPRGDSGHCVQRSDSKRETRAVVQATEAVAASPAGNDVAAKETGSAKEGPDHAGPQAMSELREPAACGLGTYSPGQSTSVVASPLTFLHIPGLGPER